MGAREPTNFNRVVEVGRDGNAQVTDSIGGLNIIGRSSVMLRLVEQMRRCAESDATVLIEGESGTGKELVARGIHIRSKRKAQPFVAINCSALPQDLAESLLFGHTKGAFTGAMYDSLGYFGAADHGAILLDEIESLARELQPKLLRVLQEKEMVPVGEVRPRRMDVRVLCASNQDLRALVRQGKFREDLYYRLWCLHLKVPPLRERREDIRPLTDYFLRQYGKPGQCIEAEVVQLFERYPWPGNVRELENSIQRLVAFSLGRVIGLADVHRCLPEVVEVIEELKSSTIRTLREECKTISQSHEKQRILEVLMKNYWNQTRAAKELGISQPALSKKVKKYGLRKELRA